MVLDISMKDGGAKRPQDLKESLSFVPPAAREKGQLLKANIESFKVVVRCSRTRIW